MTGWGDPRLPERFWSKCIPEPNSGCWFWIGSSDRKGYGRIMMGSRRDRTKSPRQAHRVAYEALVDQIPNGLHLDHLCRTAPCVNPAHLEPVTQTENTRRGLAGVYNASKTECPNGHPYAAGNVVLQLNSLGRRSRVCRVCKKASSDKYLEKRRAA